MSTRFGERASKWLSANREVASSVRFLQAAVLIALALLILACGDNEGATPGVTDDSQANVEDAAVQIDAPAPTETPELPNPGEAMLRQLEYRSNGQWARLWNELHPEHQAIVDLEAFVGCSQEATVVPFDAEIIEVFDETLPVPRIGNVATKAVTFELTISVGGEEQLTRRTNHLVSFERDWRWVTTEESLSAFENGVCPG